MSTRPAPVALLRALLRRIEDAGWSDRESAPAIEVLADGLAEHGYTDLAEAMLEIATATSGGFYHSGWATARRGVVRALRRIRAGRAAPEPEAARRARLFRYYRGRRLPPTEAMWLARRASNVGRVVAIVGSDPSNWPWTDDADVLLRESDGTYALEHLELVDEGHHHLLFRVPLPREPVPDWIDVHGIANTFGVSASLLRRRWRSRDARVRADVLRQAAAYHGWRILSDYPQHLTRREVELRYRRRYR